MSSSAICRAAVLLFIVFFAPLASAQVIFKCVGKDGTEVYQNSSCPAGSESQVVLRTDKPTRAAPSAHKNSAAAEDATSETAATQLEPRSDTPSASDPLITQSEPRLGMTQTEVKAMWGEPTEITMEEVVQGRVDTWSYGSRSLQFDAGRLSAIQR